MYRNRKDICNSCNQSSCKELKLDKTCETKKVYCSGKMDCTSCPMYVIPLNCEDFQIFSILCCSIGQYVGLKLEGSDCILRVKVCQVNQCALMGKTCSGKGPIYIKLSAIQYVDLGNEVYINPLCNVGTVGTQGSTGPKGDMGPQGPKGDKGNTGATGPMGSTGAQGPAGMPGSSGKGEKGDKGPKGDKGDTGPQGAQGPKGDKGNTGTTGPMGPTGSKGDKGDKGDMGPQGPQGVTGPTGATGASGPQGSTGIPGTIVIPPTTVPDYEYKKSKYKK